MTIRIPVGLKYRIERAADKQALSQDFDDVMAKVKKQRLPVWDKMD